MSTLSEPQNSSRDKGLLCLCGSIDAPYLAEGIAWLLMRSDWYLLYTIPKPDVMAIADLFAEYILGAEDREFTYAAEGCCNQDGLTNFLTQNELVLRCIAARPDAPENAKFAAALTYFRYCYDLNAFMELRCLAELSPSVADDASAPAKFIQQLCPLFITLEQRYNDAMESELAQFKSSHAEHCR
ncbi:MAG: hypothetical protein IKA23_04240 [Akkermansia sp.]|nr:hypothetical protein [Akkermansia sp.]MBR2314087.1 hypothetical protein [Akkermansia sp.]